MSRENVELVRRIYSSWERGDFSETWWAADDFVFEFAEGPTPVVTDLEGMSRAWRDWLQGWRSFHTRAEEIRDLGDVVLGTNTFGGEGRTSGLVPAARGATIWTIANGKVTRLVLYTDVKHGLAALGIEDG
jgi:ketosteroid isomerase-like protein